MIFLKTVTGIAVEAFRSPRGSTIHIDYVTGRVTTSSGLEITNTWAIGFTLMLATFLFIGGHMLMR